VQITINPQTVPGTLAASATVCATSNAGTLTLTGYTSAVVRWESSIDNGSTWNNILNTTSTIAYNNLTATTQYRVSVQSGVCAPQYSNVATITVLQAVTIANAGVDQVLCSTTSATLAGNVPTSGTGTWTAAPGNPSAVTFTNPNDPATSVNGLSTGVYQLVWTIANGSCAASQDIVQLTIYSTTVPGTLASDATVCATANAGSLTLTGYSSSILNWQSSINNGSTWSNILNTTSSIDFTNLTATTKYRASVQNGVCPALYSNVVTVNVMQPVSTADAGPNIIVINGIASTVLKAVAPTSGVGTWTQVLPGLTTVGFSNVHDPKATVGGLSFIAGPPAADGVYELRWTVSNGVCAVSEDIVQITVEPPTKPGKIGPDDVVCTGNNHGTLHLDDYTGTVLQWELSTNYGVDWFPIPSTVGNNQDTYVYDNLTTTTLFRALVKSGKTATKSIPALRQRLPFYKRLRHPLQDLINRSVTALPLRLLVIHQLPVRVSGHRYQDPQLLHSVTR
jgi:hypothetical protein